MELKVREALDVERRRQGLTLEDVGTKAGLHLTTVGHALSGKHKSSLEVFEKIAEALNVKITIALKDNQ